jgi:hypothetical protein
MLSILKEEVPNNFINEQVSFNYLTAQRGIKVPLVLPAVL